MKEIELNRTIQADIIGNMFINEEFIRSTQLNIVKRELEYPTHDYGSHNSLWELYQYTTFSMREIHPSLHLQDHLDAHKFFVDLSNKYSTNNYIDKRELAELDLQISPIHQMTIFEDAHYTEIQ